MIFRVFYKFLTADTAPDADSLYEAEFVDNDGNPDKQPSVYMITEVAVPQTHAEHAANAKTDPPRQKAGINVEPTGEPTFPESNGAQFKHLATSHRILRFQTDEELKRFVYSLFELKQSGQAQCIKHPKATIQGYVKDRVERKDCEWIAFLDTASSEWRKYAGIK